MVLGTVREEQRIDLGGMVPEKKGVAQFSLMGKLRLSA